VTFVGRRVRYIDSGPEYEAAVAAGPLPFAPIQDPDPTPEELAERIALEEAQQAAIIAAIKNRFDDLSGTDRVLLKIAFLQENRIRLLEGKAEITKAQFRAWVDAQI